MVANLRLAERYSVGVGDGSGSPPGTGVVPTHAGARIVRGGSRPSRRRFRPPCGRRPRPRRPEGAVPRPPGGDRVRHAAHPARDRDHRSRPGALPAASRFPLAALGGARRRCRREARRARLPGLDGRSRRRRRPGGGSACRRRLGPARPPRRHPRWRTRDLALGGDGSSRLQNSSVGTCGRATSCFPTRLSSSPPCPSRHGRRRFRPSRRRSDACDRPRAARARCALRGHTERLFHRQAAGFGCARPRCRREDVPGRMARRTGRRAVQQSPKRLGGSGPRAQSTLATARPSVGAEVEYYLRSNIEGLRGALSSP